MRFWLLSILIIFVYVSAGQTTATITGKILNAQKDSVSIIYIESGRSGGGKSVKVRLINNQFKQQINIDDLHYLEVTDGASYFTGLIEPNDDIRVEADFKSSGKPKFEGRGKEKSIYLQSYASYAPLLKARFSQAKLTVKPIDHLLLITDSISKSLEDYLDSFKGSLSTIAYNTFKGDLEGYLWQLRYQVPIIIYEKSYAELIKSNFSNRSPRFEQQQKTIFNTKESYYRSGLYAMSLATAMEENFFLLNADKQNDLESKYQYISRMLPNRLKSPVISRLLTPDIKKRSEKEILQRVINSSFSADSVSKKYFIGMLNQAFTFNIGDIAPDFTVTNVKGEKVNLLTFKNKVIYIDFWFADCPPCHALFKKTQTVKDYFENNKDVVFLTVSIDEKNIWLKSIDKFKLHGYHVYTEGQGSQHPMIQNYKVFDYPTTRLIDRAGKFFAIAPSENPEELKNQISQALFSK